MSSFNSSDKLFVLFEMIKRNYPYSLVFLLAICQAQFTNQAVANPDTKTEELQYESHWQPFIILLITVGLGVGILILHKFSVKITERLKKILSRR